MLRVRRLRLGVCAGVLAGVMLAGGALAEPAEPAKAAPPDVPTTRALPKSEESLKEYIRELQGEEKDLKSAIGRASKFQQTVAKLERAFRARVAEDPQLDRVKQGLEGVRQSLAAFGTPVDEARLADAGLRTKLVDALRALDSAVARLSEPMEFDLNDLPDELAADAAFALQPFPELQVDPPSVDRRTSDTAMFKDRLQSVAEFLNSKAVSVEGVRDAQKAVDAWYSGTAKALAEAIARLGALHAAKKQELQTARDALDSRQANGEQPKVSDLQLEKWIFPGAIIALVIIIPVLVRSLKSFDIDIQNKMLDQRFLIELLSIALLIVAIVILGTGDKLKSEALGTLLGTVGGYVLSRNLAERVGRAVSAEAQKAYVEAAAMSQGTGGPADKAGKQGTGGGAS